MKRKIVMRNISTKTNRTADAATDYGKPMRIKEMETALEDLKISSDEKLTPGTDGYLTNLAITNANGVKYMLPKKRETNEVALKAFAVTTLVVLTLVYSTYKKNKKAKINEALLDVDYNF